MKNLKVILLAILLTSVLSSSALAQARVGTVDLRKLFDAYWKTKQAQATINDHRAELAKDDKRMKSDLDQASEEYKKLLDQANDPAVAADERDRRKQAAAAKLKQLQDSKSAIDQFERQAQTTLSEQFQRMRENILTEIKAAVAAKAKAANYELVIDSAAETANGTAAIVYNSAGANDLTAAVLAQLNEGAPIDVIKASTPVKP